MADKIAVCQWHKGMTPDEGTRRGVQRIAPQGYRPGDRVTLRHNGKGAVVVSAEPMLHHHRDADWLYYVTEDSPGLGTYPTLGNNMKAGG